MVQGGRRITKKEWLEVRQLYIQDCLSVPAIVEKRKKEGKTVADQETIYKKSRKEEWRKLREDYLNNLNEQFIDELKKQGFEDFKLRKARRYVYAAGLKKGSIVPTGADITADMKMDAIGRGEATEKIETSQAEPYQLVINYPKPKKKKKK